MPAVVRQAAQTSLVRTVVVLLTLFTVATVALAPCLRGRWHALLLPAFGLCTFLGGLFPAVVIQDRLFMRYGYFANAGLALLVGALVCALGHWICGPCVRRERSL
jgi:hypothetical protein